MVVFKRELRLPFFIVINKYMMNEYDDLYVRAAWLIDNRYSDKPIDDLIEDLKLAKIPVTENTDT